MEAEKNLKKLDILLKILEEVPTKKEFVSSMENLVKLMIGYIEKLREKTEIEMEKTQTKMNEIGKMIKNDTSSEMKKIMEDCHSEIGKMYKEHEMMMMKMDKKMAEVKNVQDADEEKITEKVLSKIKIPKIEEVENDLPKLGTAIRDGLELLQGDERLSISNIKGLEKIEDEIKRIDSKSTGGGFRASHSTKFYSLTADGSTKIFSVPKSATSIVLTSDTPFILFENSGFTINKTRTQITLTTDIAPSNGAQLLYQYSEVFNT